MTNKDVKFAPVATDDEEQFLKEFNEWKKNKPEHFNSDLIKEMICKIFHKNKDAEILNAGINLTDAVSDIEMKFKGMSFDVMIFPREFTDQVKAMKEMEVSTKH